MRERREEANIHCRPMSTDDLKKVPDFFEKVIRNYKQEIDENYRLVFITVNHVVPTLLPYLKSLQELGDILSIIGKSSHTDSSVERIVKEEYPLLMSLQGDKTYPSKEKLNDKNKNYQYARDYVSNLIALWRQKEGNQTIHPKLVIIDIGGYFASPLPALCSDKRIKNILLGVVEDTENGHQKYEKIIKNSSTCPVISVARSILKETEDWNVGKSIVEATDSLLRMPMHTIIERSSYTGVIGYGKIGSSIAFHCKNKGLNVLVCEFNPLRRMKASSQGFKTVDPDTIYQMCSLIFAATGMQSIQKTDFGKLQDNVVISSCTSADDEFDLSWLLENKKEELNCDYEHYGKAVTTYLIGDKGEEKRINLLQEGNAVNFRFNGVNGPYICSVQASLLVAAMQLTRIERQNDIIHELPESILKNIASLWNFSFDDKLPGLSDLSLFSSDNHEERDPRIDSGAQLEQCFLKSRTVYLVADEYQLPIQFAKTWSSERLKQSYYRLVLYFDGSHDFYLEIKNFIRKTNDIFSMPHLNVDRLSKTQLIKWFHQRLRQEGEWILILNANKMSDADVQTIMPPVLFYHQHVLIIKNKNFSPEIQHYIELSDYTIEEAKYYLSEKNIFTQPLIKKMTNLSTNPMLLKYIAKGVKYSKKYTRSESEGLGFVNGFIKFINQNSGWEKSLDEKINYVLDYLAGKESDNYIFIEIRNFLSLLACLNYDTLSHEMTRKIAGKIWRICASEELDKVVDKGLLIKESDHYSLPFQLRESLLDDTGFLKSLFKKFSFPILLDICSEKMSDHLCKLQLLKIVNDPEAFGIVIKSGEKIRMTYNLYINLVSYYDDNGNFISGIKYCEKAYDILNNPVEARSLNLDEAEKIELYGCWVKLLYKADKQIEALEKCLDFLNMRMFSMDKNHESIVFTADSGFKSDNFPDDIIEMSRRILLDSIWDHDLIGIIRTLANILGCFDFLDAAVTLYGICLDYYEKYSEDMELDKTNKIKEAHATILMEFSWLLSRTNDRDSRLKAVSLFSEAIDTYRPADKGLNLIIQAKYLVVQLRMKNDLAQHFQQPLKEIRLKIREECSEDSMEYAEILKLHSECSAANQHFEKAISYLDQAIELLKQFYDPEYSVEIFKNLKLMSNYYFSAGDMDKAKSTMNEAITILVNLQDTEQTIRYILLPTLKDGFKVSDIQIGISNKETVKVTRNGKRERDQDLVDERPNKLIAIGNFFPLPKKTGRSQQMPVEKMQNDMSKK